MAKIFKKYKKIETADYSELSLLEEAERIRTEFFVGSEKCSPQPEPMETMETYNFYYKEESQTSQTSQTSRTTLTPLTGRCSSSSLTDPEEWHKSLSSESCSSEYYDLSRNESFKQTVKRLTKDEKVAREEGIDKFISVEEIINMDMTELKEELLRNMAGQGMSQQQYDSSMAIRKRGKNKSAAQNCRRKKQKEIETLGSQVKLKKVEIQENFDRHEKLKRKRDEWALNLERLCTFILREKNHDPNTHEVHVEDETVSVKRKKEQSMPPLLNIHELHSPPDIQYFQHLAILSRYNQTISDYIL